MNTEISAIMDQSGRVLDWANAVKYSPAELSAEDKEISAVTDAWVKELGKTGYDKDHELSALITKTFTPETVSAPSELIDMLFKLFKAERSVVQCGRKPETIIYQCRLP